MTSSSVKVLNNYSLNRLKFFYKTLMNFSTYGKEPAKLTSMSAVSTPDYLLQNLKNARTPDVVLELVGSHHKIMNSKQLMQALRSLFSLQKYGNSKLSTQQIMQHPDFERLCYHLKSQASLIELNETIEALKVVSYVGVSSKSTIVQVLLQLLRQNVNDLSLHQIIFLDFLLRQFKRCPLVDALLIALPIVFEVHLPVKMDKQSSIHIAEYLQYASKKNVSAQCIELLVTALNKLIDTGEIVNVETAKSIIWSICDMDEDYFFEPLFRKSLKILLEDFDKLDYRDVATVLTKMVFKYSVKFPFYYDEVFMDTSINYIVDNDLGFEEATYALKKCLRVNHSHVGILNYISKKCKEDPNVLLQTSPFNVSNLVLMLGLTEFRPTHWNSVKEGLIKTDCFKNEQSRDILWLKLATAFCSLDIYKFEVLEMALNKSYLDYIFKQQCLFDYENFLLLNQAITIFQPDYKYLLPSSGIVNNIALKLKPIIDYPLEIPLQKGLGGENYVKTCIKSEMGYHIDHIVILRKGGFPVSLSKNGQCLEEISIPPESHMILILALASFHYTMNTKILKGTSALMIKTMEAKGYNVLPICMDIWESMPDFEKIPYLMQAIRQKIENPAEISDIV